MKSYNNPVFAYRPCADQHTGAPARHPVVVIGAGPVGLVTAIDLAVQGQAVVVLDDDQTVSVGSRAVCHAKRTLEILDRLGCGQPVVDRGISWSRGRVFLREREVYSFDLLAEPGHRRPAFVNLQQYHLEEALVSRAASLPALDLRWRNRVTGVQAAGDGVLLTVETPDGPYELACDWLVVADGARSPVRHLLGLQSEGRVFRDRFLIADVLMKADYPTERWFWFDPPFHPGQSVLLHRQADNLWRVDFQLGPDADPEEEKKPERVLPRLRAMLGDRDFDLEWVSVYTFQCRRMEAFRHGRMLFAGDSAHQVSPFGARGGNSGIQDADALAWRLARVVRGEATESVLDAWAHERQTAADENILNSTRSTDFISPKSTIALSFRNAALELAETLPFARRMVNSGRLSTPTIADDSPANTADAGTGESIESAEPAESAESAEFAEPADAGGAADAGAAGAAGAAAAGADRFAAPAMRPGAPSVDAPLVSVDGQPQWWLNRIGGEFDLLIFTGSASPDTTASPAQLDALRKALGAAGLPTLRIHRVMIRASAPVANPGALDADLALGGVLSEILTDADGVLAGRCDARPGTVYLLRPDQHVCARWRGLDPQAVAGSMARALGRAIGRPLVDSLIDSVFDSLGPALTRQAIAAPAATQT
jgi:3-(3-hydroxy-phenyl)propionate hydroxylase